MIRIAMSGVELPGTFSTNSEAKWLNCSLLTDYLLRIFVGGKKDVDNAFRIALDLGVVVVCILKLLD